MIFNIRKNRILGFVIKKNLTKHHEIAIKNQTHRRIQVDQKRNK